MNQFMAAIVAQPRSFDTNFWNALQAIELRTVAAIAMYAIALEMARNDTIILRPSLGRRPTIDEFLRAERYTQKSLLTTAYMESLAVCAAQKASLDKYRATHLTLLRDEMAKFCNIGAGVDIFTIRMAYEMTLLTCYEYWTSFFKKINDWVRDMVETPRRLDMESWTLLRNAEPRTKAAMDNLSWPDSIEDHPFSPFEGTTRSSELFTMLSDVEYERAHRHASAIASLKVPLIGRRKWQSFAQRNVPTM